MTWPYLTDSNLKISGRFKASDEDFIVEEIPLYLPTGSGEHLYIFLEKSGLATDQVIHKLSNALGIKAMNIGFAGKKDRVGITRQWFSLLNIKKKQLQNLQIPGTRILEMEYHKNKLRPGHLKGNRFIICMQGVEKDSLTIVQQIIQTLQCYGVPNYFGAQRFGAKGDNPAIGLAVLQDNWESVFKLILGNPTRYEKSAQILRARELFEQGEYKKALEIWPNDQYFAKTALRYLNENNGNFAKTGKQLPKNQLRFYLNSLQAFWFNHSLAKRLPKINQIWPGDLAYLHKNGAVFKVKDAKAEQPRAETFEISPSGPIWGSKMIRPEGEELNLENAVLHEHRCNIDALKTIFHHWRLEGERRSYREAIKHAEVSEKNNCLKISFDLASGSYATSVVREILKDNVEEPEVKSDYS